MGAWASLVATGWAMVGQGRQHGKRPTAADAGQGEARISCVHADAPPAAGGREAWRAECRQSVNHARPRAAGAGWAPIPTPRLWLCDRLGLGEDAGPHAPARPPRRIL